MRSSACRQIESGAQTGEAMNNIPINKGQFTLESSEREALFEKNRGFGDEATYAENRRQWTEFPRQQHLADYPLHVDIELASVCNLKCPMCYTITDEFKQKVNAKLMDFNLYKKIVDECAKGNVYSIRLSLRGESFLHKHIVDAVRYAKEKGIKEVSTLTNGLRLDEKMFQEIMEAGIDWITISFDGLRETYERIRHPAKYERALEKLKNYMEIKRKAGRVKPVIKVQSILPAIIDNLEEFYATMSKVSDMVSANPLIDYLANDSGDKILYEENFVCPMQYQRLVIGADGIVMMCSNDEENSQPVGNANSQTVHEIWHGPEMTRVREIQKRHAGVKEIGCCKKCYLPRKTEPQILQIEGRQLTAENYVNRSQVIGT